MFFVNKGISIKSLELYKLIGGASVFFLKNHIEY